MNLLVVTEGAACVLLVPEVRWEVWWAAQGSRSLSRVSVTGSRQARNGANADTRGNQTADEKMGLDASSRGSRITKTRHGSGEEEGERDKEDGKRKTALSHGRW